MVLAVASLEPCRKEERFCEAIKSEFSEAATALSSWMVCSSSDSEGRSLKVLSSLPGASREKRRTKWGRPVVSAGLASFQAFFGSAVSLESVTALPLVEVPLFWFTSASPANNKDEIWIQACEKQNVRTMLLSSPCLELAASHKNYRLYATATDLPFTEPKTHIYINSIKTYKSQVGVYLFIHLQSAL